MKNKFVITNPGQTKKMIREFYRELPADQLYLEDDSNFRQFKFRCFDSKGRVKWRAIRDRITSKKKLKKYLVRFSPIDVYCSIGFWLNPSTLGKKPDGILLYSDYVVDCDHRDIREVNRIHRYLDDKFDNESYLVFSGGGFHVRVDKLFRIRIKDPVKREKEILDSMKKLTLELIDNDFIFDYFPTPASLISVSYDTRRVVKYPNTLTSYGNLAQIVEDLDKFKPREIMEIDKDVDERVNVEEWLNELT